MQETHAPAAEPSEGNVAVAARASRWTAGRIAALAIGSLLVLLSLCLLGAGGTGVWADRTQREGGYATTDVHHFSATGSALATKRTELGAAGFGWLYAPDILGKVRVRVTPESPGPVFVGIGPSAEVDRYLAGVKHTVISDFWRDDVESVGGGSPGSPPGRQSFWAASESGSGQQSLVWDPADGDWTVVVMNADGRAGIEVGADLGAKVPALLWVSIGLLLGGAIFLVGGGLLIASAVRRGASPPATSPPS